jgi:uncharacterized NAD(P)/FAD-binding protein YdhS
MLGAASDSGRPRTIAIAGGGFSGAMVAVHLLRNAPVPIEISLIERRPVLGQGPASSTTLGTHVLNVPASGEAFLDGLLRAGIAQADPFGLGLRTAGDGALIASDGTVSTRIFTLGSARRGDLWESTAVPELRVQAARLAERLIAPDGTGPDLEQPA